MESILIGNGANIQYDKKNYTTKSIILRMIDDMDKEDFPFDCIVNEPILLKNYLAELFLGAQDLLNGDLDIYAFGKAEVDGIQDFIERYKPFEKSLRIADIGFEDYYLIHDLLCHKFHVVNPDQYSIREALKMSYFHSIYNGGQINFLYQKFSIKFIEFLEHFDSIFTTNYDSNVEKATQKTVYHLHGQFDRLTEVYNPNSLRNRFGDNSLEGVHSDPKYTHLHSTALSTYCGDYKKYLLVEKYLANQALDKMVVGYQSKDTIKTDVDKWEVEDNPTIANIAKAVKLKIENPELKFQEDYSLNEFKSITDELVIFGLSPYNDYHLFEMIDDLDINKCVYYYYDNKECERIEFLLQKLHKKGVLLFEDVKKFWGEINK